MSAVHALDTASSFSGDDSSISFTSPPPALAKSAGTERHSVAVTKRRKGAALAARPPHSGESVDPGPDALPATDRRSGWDRCTMTVRGGGVLRISGQNSDYYWRNPLIDAHLSR